MRHSPPHLHRQRRHAQEAVVRTMAGMASSRLRPVISSPQLPALPVHISRGGDPPGSRRGRHGSTGSAQPTPLPPSRPGGDFPRRDCPAVSEPILHSPPGAKEEQTPPSHAGHLGVANAPHGREGHERGCSRRRMVYCESTLYLLPADGSPCRYIKSNRTSLRHPTPCRSRRRQLCAKSYAMPYRTCSRGCRGRVG